MLPVPQPLRVLITWPEPAATQLRRALEALPPAVKVTQVPASELIHYLSTPDFYHILHLAPEAWRSLTHPSRQKFIRRIRLLVLGPAPALPDDIADQVASLYFPVACPLPEAIARLAETHAWLAQGQTLAKCVTQSQGRLASGGGEPIWHVQTAPDKTPAPTSPLPAADVAPSQTTNSNIAIGEINVTGDLVIGSKVVNLSAGDQINHSNLSANKVVQHADGNQVNINRFPAGCQPPLTQTAGQDQVNVNSARSASSPRTCPQCLTTNEAANSVCRQCGMALGQ
jgi:hypothetical protein